MSVRWILPNLGTAPAMSASASEDTAVLDVRDLVDKGGNTSDAVLEKIKKGTALLREGKRVIVACDYGISRSNAIAAGIIASVQGISVDAAIREVIARTDEREIKLELLAAVHAALGSGGDALACPATTVLVTGANGFLGSALLERLVAHDIKVIAPNRAEVDLERSRAELDILVREQNVGQIVHLANPRVYTSNLALGTTLSMLRNVLEVCSLNGIKLIYPSGWEIYSGYRSQNIIADEHLPPLPLGPYGETKWLCEQLVTHFRTHASLKCTMLRMSPVYGANGTRPKFIYNFAQKARRDESIITHRYRNAPAGLDLLHRDDAANALALAVTNGFTGDLNIGTGAITSTEQIARWIVEWSGSKSDVSSILIDADTARVAMDWRLAHEKIGWSPSIEPCEGLRAAMALYFDTPEKQDA